MYKLRKQDERYIGKIVYEAVKRYFQNNEHRRAFEEWHLATYGKPYEWKGESQWKI